MSRFALIIASFMLSAASTAHTPGDWIQVAGGAWTPDEATMNEVSTGLQAYAETAARNQRRELLPWSEYSFQYQGREAKGRKYIYIVALCSTVGNPDLSASFFEVLGGGTCYFGLTFDLEHKRYEDLRINALR